MRVERAARETAVGGAIVAKPLHVLARAAEHADGQSAAERLAVRDEIGAHAEVLLGAAAGQSETEKHLVEDQDDPAFRAHLSQLAQPLGVSRAVERGRASAVDQRRVAGRRRVRVQRLQRIHEHAGDVVARGEHAQRLCARLLQRVDVVDPAAVAEAGLHAVPPAVIRAAEQHDAWAARVELREPYGLHHGFGARHVKRHFVEAGDGLDPRDVVANQRVVGAEHRAQVRDAGGAGRDAALVEVVAEQVHAIGACEIVRPVAVEILELRAARFLDDGADSQMTPNVLAKLERNAVRIREQHVGEPVLELGRQRDRSGRALPRRGGEAIERGPALRDDVVRGAVAGEELVLVVADERHLRRDSPRELGMARDRWVLGAAQLAVGARRQAAAREPRRAPAVARLTTCS